MIQRNLTEADFTHGVANSAEPPALIAEASSLGLRAIEGAPRNLYVDGICYTMSGRDVRDGDLRAWNYRNAAGRRLVLLND